MEVISGKWVDAVKTPGVAKSRWVLRGFEAKALASLVAVRLILVWMLAAG